DTRRPGADPARGGAAGGVAGGGRARPGRVRGPAGRLGRESRGGARRRSGDRGPGDPAPRRSGGGRGGRLTGLGAGGGVRVRRGRCPRCRAGRDPGLARAGAAGDGREPAADLRRGGCAGGPGPPVDRFARPDPGAVPAGGGTRAGAARPGRTGAGGGVRHGPARGGGCAGAGRLRRAAARFGGSSGAASRALPGRDRAPTGYPAGVRAGPERTPAVRWLDAGCPVIHLDDGESGDLLIVRSSSPVYPALRLLPAGVSTTMFAPTATRVQGSIVTAYRVIGPWPAGQDAGFIQPQSPCRLEGWDRSGGEAFV